MFQKDTFISNFCFSVIWTDHTTARNPLLCINLARTVEFFLFWIGKLKISLDCWGSSLFFSAICIEHNHSVRHRKGQPMKEWMTFKYLMWPKFDVFQDVFHAHLVHPKKLKNFFVHSSTNTQFFNTTVTCAEIYVPWDNCGCHVSCLSLF